MWRRALGSVLARRTAAAAMLVVSAASVWAFDFKGLVLGAPTTPADIDSRLNTGCKSPFEGRACSREENTIYEMSRVRCGAGSNGATVCNGSTTILGHPAQVNVVISAQGTLRRILLTNINASDFDGILPELTAKYGTPKSIGEPTVQNGFGAAFRQTMVLWTNEAQDQVIFRRYASNVRYSSLLFSTAEDRAVLSEVGKGQKGDL